MLAINSHLSNMTFHLSPANVRAIMHTISGVTRICHVTGRCPKTDEKIKLNLSKILSSISIFCPVPGQNPPVPGQETGMPPPPGYATTHNARPPGDSDTTFLSLCFVSVNKLTRRSAGNRERQRDRETARERQMMTK